MRTKKTLGEHCKYVEEMSRVSFYCAFLWHKQLPELDLEEVIRRHTPLFYHALDLEPKIIIPGFKILKAGTAEEFEERMWEQIKPLAIARATRFYHSSVGMCAPEDWNCGSLKYDCPLPGLPRNYCNFHIANAVAPRSIFDDPDYLPGCFLLLVEKSSKEYGFDTLRTSTWLCDEPRFLACLPDEWRENRVLQPYYEDKPEIPGWSFGNWGQLVTARGTFNIKMGEYVRKNLTMRYKTYISQCSFKNLVEHIERNFHVKKSS